jgi:hypothetical protein
VRSRRSMPRAAGSPSRSWRSSSRLRRWRDLPRSNRAQPSISTISNRVTRPSSSTETTSPT